MICIIGIFYLSGNPFEFIPKKNYSSYKIITSYGNNSPKILDTLVTEKIFESLSHEEFIRNPRAISSVGVSHIFFEMKKDHELRVREILRELKEGFPPEVDLPTLLETGDSDSPFMKLVFKEPGIDLLNFQEELLQIPGVLYTSLSGETSPKIFKLDSEKLELSGVKAEELQNLIAVESGKKPAGRIVDGLTEKSLIGKSSEFGERFPFRIPIDSFLSSSSEQTPSPLMDGNPVKVLEVTISDLASPVVLSKEIRNKLNIFKSKSHSDSLIYYDRWDSILKGLSDFLVVLISSIFIGAFLVASVYKNKEIFFVFLFTLISTYLYTSFFYFLIGKKINLYSLIGISLGTGLVFDFGITILKSQVSNSKSKIGEIYLIIRSSFYSLLTTLIIFFPLYFLNSPLCDMYSEFSFSICITIFFGFINSYLIFYLYIQYHSDFRELSTHYQKFSSKLEFSKLILFSVFSLFFISLFFIKLETYPETHESEFLVKLTCSDPGNKSKNRYFQTFDTQIRSLDFVESSLGIPEKDGGRWNIKVKSGNGKKYYSQILNIQLCDHCRTEISLINPYISGNFDAGNLQTLMIPTDINRDSLRKLYKHIYNNKIQFLNDTTNLSSISPSLSLEKLSIMEKSHRENIHKTFSPIFISQTKREKTIFEFSGKAKSTHLKDFEDEIDSGIALPIHRKKGYRYYPLVLLTDKSELGKLQKQISSELNISLNISEINRYEVIIELIYSSFLGILLLISVLYILYESIYIIFTLCTCIFFVFLFAYLFLFIQGNSLNSGSFLGICILSGMSVDPILLVLESARENSKFQLKKILGARNKVQSIVHLNVCTSILGSLCILLFSGFNQFQSSIAISMLGGISGLFLYYTYIFPFVLFKFQRFL